MTQSPHPALDQDWVAFCLPALTPPQSSHPAKLGITQCLGLFVLNVSLRRGLCYFFRHRLIEDFCLNRLFIAHAASIPIPWRPGLAVLQRWCRVMTALSSVSPHVHLCAWHTVRLNTPNVGGLKQRKVYCRARQGERVAHAHKTPNSLEGFSKAFFFNQRTTTPLFSFSAEHF